MAEHRNYITPRGYKRHRDEYQWLRVVVRPRIVEEVAHAASLGDRSENAEYIYGKKKLREVDRRLRHLARRMGACEVVDPAIDRGDTVFFGATVTLAWPDGADEVDIGQRHDVETCDDEDDESERIGHYATGSLWEPIADQHAECAADNDGDHVDECSEADHELLPRRPKPEKSTGLGRLFLTAEL